MRLLRDMARLSNAVTMAGWPGSVPQDAAEDRLRLNMLCKIRLGPVAAESSRLLATSAIRFSSTRSVAMRL